MFPNLARDRREEREEGPAAPFRPMRLKRGRIEASKS
jgi:hypothetical protein